MLVTLEDLLLRLSQIDVTSLSHRLLISPWEELQPVQPELEKQRLPRIWDVLLDSKSLCSTALSR
jgi:hypothetical protein